MKGNTLEGTAKKIPMYETAITAKWFSGLKDELGKLERKIRHEAFSKKF
jgi:hypothetical protein